MHDLEAEKKRLRAEARALRAAIPQDARKRAAQAIAGHGLGFAGSAPPCLVAGYTALGDEMDPAPLLSRLAHDGHRLALPAVRAEGAALEFRAWAPGEVLTPGRWGILEPSASAPVVEPGVLLLPLLAFDRRGGRIGYGGGFYDRTLAALRASRRVPAIGLAYAEQEVDAVPRLDYDERLDWVLTPSGPLRCTEN